MPKGLITIQSNGLKELISEFESLENNYDSILKESLISMQTVIENGIKKNWVSMTGGKTGDYVFDSVGQSTNISTQNEHTVIGTTGVYNIDKVNSKHGKTKKDLNAAQIAYWVEFGTSRLRYGGRKVKGMEYDEEALISVNPIPFVSNAAYQTHQEQNKAFVETFNMLADKYK